MKIINVVGARPNFVKISPIMEEMNHNGHIKPMLIHTGQHYDYEMSKVFFEDLEIPEPDIYLGVGSGTQAEQTGKIMIEFEKVLFHEKPDLVLVVGDVNSTLACSLVASKLCIPIAHVEAGLRSFDRTMPEEINRAVTDSLSDYLFTPSKEANRNLKREGILEKKIYFVGNVMIDTLLKYMDKVKGSDILSKLKLEEKSYAVLTLHRPTNVDNPEVFKRILSALNVIQTKIDIVFPTHFRTKKKIEEFKLEEQIKRMKCLRIIEPLGYLDFIRLMRESRFVMTDSGGVQEETTVLGIPCLTLRDNTERPETISRGTNTIAGIDKEMLISESERILDGQTKIGEIPELWDGKTAQRVIAAF